MMNKKPVSKKKMKHIVCLTMAGCLAFGAAGCKKDSGANQRVGKPTNAVEAALQSGMAAADGSASSSTVIADVMQSDLAASQITTANQTLAPADPNVDVDLTVLSATMVYSEVYGMVYEPDRYIGKTVKMKGLFDMYHDETTDKYYFACVIMDATACCAQGIEFELKGEHKYPDDYPKVGDEITVTGTFATYMEGDQKYCTLKDAAFME